MRFWQTLGLIVLSLGTAGLMASAWWHVRPNQVVGGYVAPTTSASAKPRVTASPSPSGSEAASSAPDERLRAVFMGDAIVAGTGGGGVRWTKLVAEEHGWKEINLGRAGTGYLTSVTGAKAKSTCGKAECLAFPDMVPEVVDQNPNVVVLASASNTTSDLSEVSLAMFRDLRKQLPEARIIVLSPLWRSSAYPSNLLSLGKVLKKSAEQADVEYVDVGSPLKGHPEWMAADGINPNAAGQKALAKVIAPALAD